MTEEELESYAGPDRIVKASEMREELASRPKNEIRFLSGFSGLDRLIEGFEGGELIAVTGPTKNGKTALCQTFTHTFAKQGIKSLWTSFEVPMPLFLKQMPSDTEFYIPRVLKPYNPDWLEERIIEAKLKADVRAVFIDHLHFLIDMIKGYKNISIDIGQVIRKLKRSAIKNNIVIFLLCHSTKAQTATGEIRELGAFDIRDSSFVRQEADSTMVIQRKMDKSSGEYTNRAMLKVCNHRRTGAMEKRITLVKEGLLFTEEVLPGDAPTPEPTYFYQTVEDDPIPF